MIALTGFADPDIREGCLAAGFDAHLIKPGAIDELAQLLARIRYGPNSSRRGAGVFIRRSLDPTHRALDMSSLLFADGAGASGISDPVNPLDCR